MARARKPQPQCPPDWSTFPWPNLKILCFDQTIRNTGWAVLRVGFGTSPQVLMHGTLRTALEGAQGFVDNLARATIIGQEMDSLIRTIRLTWDIDWIVHEMPAVFGFRADSSLMAATALHVVLGLMPNRPEVRMINNQATKKWITGDVKASKQRLREGVFQIVPKFRTNEHVADAIALGFAELARIHYETELAAWRASAVKVS